MASTNKFASCGLSLKLFWLYEYCSKKDEMAWIKQEVDNGNYAIGFGLNAPSLNQLKAIADANLTLPPKSTYIYPKLRSGMTIYEF